MRVVHVVRQFAPSVGGLEDVVLNLARRQRAAGIDARVVTLDSVFTRPGRRLAAYDEVAGIPVRRLRWWGSSRYPLAPGVLRHLAGADLVHVHAIDFFADFLALTRWLHRRPMIVTTHGGFFHTGHQAGLKRLWFATVTRLSLRAYRAVVAVSANDASVFARLRPRHLVTVENGADLDKLRGAAATPLPHRILTLGRFAPHKRIGTLFPLLARLHAQAPDWELVVAGVESGETVASLTDQARAAGVEQAVRFVVGAPDAALAREAAEATWFACASAFEGFGVAAVEAAAAGLVPLLSRIPTFERLAASLPHAVLFDPDDPAMTATAVIALDRALAAGRPQARIALAAAAARHDWTHVSARTVALYHQVLGTHPAEALA